MRPSFLDHFWSRVGGVGGPTGESKASPNSPGLAQGVSDHGPLDSAMSNMLFYKCDKEHNKKSRQNQRRATMVAVVAAAVAVAAQIVVSCSNPGARGGAAGEPPDVRIDSQISVWGPCFGTLFLASLASPFCSVLPPNWLPKWCPNGVPF